MASLFSNYRLVKDSGLFDEIYYCNAYPEIKEKNLDPLLHYLETGASELRNPNAAFDARSYVQRCRERGEDVGNPLIHYIESRDTKGTATQPQADIALPVPAEAESISDLLVNLDRVTIESGSDVERLRGYGWCLASSPIVEVEVKLGSVSCGARYGLQRADVAREFPRALKADHSGFEFSLEPIPQDQTGKVELVFAAKTADGASLLKSVNVDLGAVRGAAHPTDAAGNHVSRTPFSRPPMQLQIDSAEVDSAGILRVVGWAVCLAPIASIEVFVDDTRIGAAEYGKARDDVAETHPEYPNARNSGFLLYTDCSSFAAGGRLIKVQAIASTGISRELLLPLRIPGAQRGAARSDKDTKVDCFCDLIEVTTGGRVLIKGWAVGVAATERISVLLDDREIGDAEINLERPDVGNRFPSLAHARRAGFAFKHNGESVSAGEHLIILRHRAGGEETEILLPVMASESTRVDVEVESSSNSGPKDLMLSMDRPEVVDGAAVATVRGDLEIVGWGLARRGPISIDVAIDGQILKSVSTGIPRADVQRAFPDWEDAATAGFTALLPNRSLPEGRHTLSVSLRDAAGAVTRREFRVEIDTASEIQGPWSIRRRIEPAAVQLLFEPLLGQSSPPSFDILLPLPRSSDAYDRARVTLASLASQVYENWTVWIFVPKENDEPSCRGLIKGFDALSTRVVFVAGESSERSDLLPSEAQASHVMFLRPGDELGCDALLQFAAKAILDPKADFVYADDRRLSPYSGKVEAFFKPQWSPDLLLSTNYLGRAWCASAALWRSIGTYGREASAVGDYDVALRLTENATAIDHIPATLLEATGSWPPETVERRALRDALKRRGIIGTVKPGRSKGALRVQRKVASRKLVSIIIPTCAARGLIKKCIESLRTLTAYRRYEIVCIENIPADKQDWKDWVRAHADTVIETTEPFNWSRFNNLAVAAARGAYLLFLNDDVEIIDPAWLHALLEHVSRPDVGAVGPQLLYPDRRVQHAGMFLAQLGVARHAFRYAGEDDPGYFGLALTQRDVIAVTGACLMTRRETFEALGRFDEAHEVINNDVDYCLRVWKQGLRTIYTPYTRLIHHELASRAELAEKYEATSFENKWRSVYVTGDPFFHPRLAKDRDDYSVEWEPVASHCAARPVLKHGTVHRILIVKLDHIGDCVIAFPAIRRLKHHFPDAKLVALSGRSSRAVWALEPAIEEVIEFDFFHARSSLGKIERTEEELCQLRERLRPWNFDLAIDLRKHSETRHILQYTGARCLAGFDTKGKFPWLDVALEWAEDSALIRKRQHAADDLINLIDAVAASTETEPALIARSSAQEPDESSSVLPIPAEMSRKRLVCVHAGAGNEMKQWPIEYFVVLIDHLVETEDVNIVLVGGPDEDTIGDQIIGASVHKQSIWSLIGQVKLGDLPKLISRCCLFVGNDSGPKHIAAGLGVPTVGIHSGVVDAHEWGPKGVKAVAIHRAMSCAPCYHSKLEQCNRGLACLRGLLPDYVAAACHRMLAASARGPTVDRTGTARTSKSSENTEVRT
jgi:ADP-heptose:LPS heptosyltransferase/GT2 family glycosyltransferase